MGVKKEVPSRNLIKFVDDEQLSKQQDLDLKYKQFILFSTALLHTNIEFHIILVRKTTLFGCQWH